MADKTFADYRFWIDSNTAVLIEITSYVNSVSLQGVLNLMDNGAMNDVNGTALPGVHRKSAPINGFINSTTEPIFGPHLTARTSITKTVQISTASSTTTARCGRPTSRCPARLTPS